MTVYGSIELAFEENSRSYDAERPVLVPCFESFYGNAIEIVLEAVGSVDKPAILDLGAGTGLFSALIAHQLPTATFHLVDLLEPMLDKARERFAAESSRFSMEAADLRQFVTERKWNAVISGLAIHHLPDESKRRIYENIATWLEPGGVFVNAEQVLGPTVDLEERYERIWQAQVRAGGGNEESLARSMARMEFDLCATVDDQLGWLRSAGFHQVDCTFKSWRFAVLAAWR